MSRKQLTAVQLLPVFFGIADQKILHSRPGRQAECVFAQTKRGQRSGHTLLMVAASFSINPSVYAKLPGWARSQVDQIARVLNCTNIEEESADPGKPDIEDPGERGLAGSVAPHRRGRQFPEHVPCRIP